LEDVRKDGVKRCVKDGEAERESNEKNSLKWEAKRKRRFTESEAAVGDELERRSSAICTAKDSVAEAANKGDMGSIARYEIE
jgi:hypothetical protein